MKIIFSDEHLLLKKGICGVYKILINEKWFYIGSSVDIKRRLGAWKHYLGGKSKKPYRRNRSIAYIMPTIETVNFEIIELSEVGSQKIREDYYIKENFNNEYCLNLIPDAINGRGRKLPLGVIRREKKIKGLPTPKKPVAIFDMTGNLIIKCESIFQASQETGVKADTIRKIFAGKAIKPRNFVFKPINKDGSIGEIKYATKLTPEVLKFIMDNFLKLGCAEVSRRTGIRQDRINHIVRGRTSKIAGILPNGTVWQPKKVIKMDSNGNELETYESIGAAAKSIGVKTSTIQEIVHGRGRYQCRGFKFKFA